MATQQITILSDNLASASENLSAQFTDAIGFYLIAPASSFEYQIDIFLQVELSNTITRMVRLEPSNVSNTERITLLPQQIVDLGLPMRLSILPSEGFFLEVILLQSDCSLCSLNSKVDALSTKIDDLIDANSNLTAIVNLIFDALGIPTPPALPALIEQTFFFLQ